MRMKPENESRVSLRSSKNRVTVEKYALGRTFFYAQKRSEEKSSDQISMDPCDLDTAKRIMQEFQIDAFFRGQAFVELGQGFRV